MFLSLQVLNVQGACDVFAFVVKFLGVYWVLKHITKFGLLDVFKILGQTFTRIYKTS